MNPIKNVIRSVFTVKEKRHLTPHYIRIIFDMSDEQIALFRKVRIGAHNKIFIPESGTNRVVFPGEPNVQPSVRRTYTTRHIDYTRKELWIDFVAHGDNGPASYWASRAVPGSVLGIAMKEGHKPLLREADEYLFVGDSTALPVIGAMLEQLPEGVKVKAILEVSGAADEIELSSKASPSIEWLHNPEPEKGSRVAAFVQNSVLSNQRRFVFVAAEYDTAKDLKRYLKDVLAWPPERYSVISYWKRGDSEDASSAERQQERHN